MFINSSVEVCKRCNRIFRSGERKRLLQNYHGLCEFVFSSGLIDIRKLIDVSQLDIPVCNVCYQYLSRQLRVHSGNTNEESMEADLSDTPITLISTVPETHNSGVTSITESDSRNMIIDPPAITPIVTATITATASPVPQSPSPALSVISLPFYRLAKSNSRCSICSIYFADTVSSPLEFNTYIRARAFLEHRIFILSGSRCCDKHMNTGYLTTVALQLLQIKEKKCDRSHVELMEIFDVVAYEFLSKVSSIQAAGHVPPLNFDDLARLSPDNHYVLTGLSLQNFDNLCSRIPPTALKNTQNRSSRTAIACLLMKLRLGVSHEVLATLLAFKDKRTVSRVIHSARKALVEHFVPRFLGFGHIKRHDVIDLHRGEKLLLSTKITITEKVIVINSNHKKMLLLLITITEKSYCY